jgi:hypothetical protein
VVALVLSVFLLGCAEPLPAEGGGGQAQDYLPQDGQFSTFIPADNPDGPALWLLAETDLWTLKLGPRWADASPWAVWSVDSADGLVLNDQTLLPARPETGWVSDDQASGGASAEIVDIGQATAWYGTFPVAATLETTGSPLEGEQVFAVGLGLVVFEIGGERWELAYYE